MSKTSSRRGKRKVQHTKTRRRAFPRRAVQNLDRRNDRNNATKGRDPNPSGIRQTGHARMVEVPQLENHLHVGVVEWFEFGVADAECCQLVVGIVGVPYCEYSEDGGGGAGSLLGGL